MKAKLVFFEIPANDFERAVEFYQNTLQFNIEVCKSEKEQMGMIELEGLMGSISKADGFIPSSTGTIVSFGVEDIDKTLSLINKHGGKTICAKTKIEAEGMGYFALFGDTEGNMVGLYSDN